MVLIRTLPLHAPEVFSGENGFTRSYLANVPTALPELSSLESMSPGGLPFRFLLFYGGMRASLRNETAPPGDGVDRRAPCPRAPLAKSGMSLSLSPTVPFSPLHPLKKGNSLNCSGSISCAWRYLRPNAEVEPVATRCHVDSQIAKSSMSPQASDLLDMRLTC